MTRTRGTALALAAILFAITAATARADFSEVVAAIEARGGHQKTAIPLFGLVRMIIWVTHPEGVHDLQLATWEGKRFSIDGREIEPLLRAKAGEAYRPMVTVRSRNGEWTYIYTRPAAGDLMEMLLVTHDQSDTTAVRALIDPKRLVEEINNRHHHGHVQFAWR